MSRKSDLRLVARRVVAATVSDALGNEEMIRQDYPDLRSADWGRVVKIVEHLVRWPKHDAYLAAYLRRAAACRKWMEKHPARQAEGDALTRYFLSGCFQQHQQIQSYAEQLEQAIRGARVVSTWHSQPDIAAEDALTPAELTLHPDQGQGYAAQDLEELDQAQVLVLFSGFGGQGGRHVEYGYALAKGKRLVLVGPRDNVFSCLPQAEWFPSFTAWLEYEKSISR